MRGDGGVQADHLAVEVDERTAAGAGIDGRVGLQKILDANGPAQADLAALAGADDAVRDRLVQAKGTAECQDPLADADPVAVAQWGGRQFAGIVQAQYGNIGFGIGPDLGWAEQPAVGKVDPDLFRFGLRNDVVVGQHVNAGAVVEADQNAGAGIFDSARFGKVDVDVPGLVASTETTAGDTLRATASKRSPIFRTSLAGAGTAMAGCDWALTAVSRCGARATLVQPPPNAQPPINRTRNMRRFMVEPPSGNGLFDEPERKRPENSGRLRSRLAKMVTRHSILSADWRTHLRKCLITNKKLQLSGRRKRKKPAAERCGLLR